MFKPIHELSMSIDCAFSGLPEATCSHCLGQDEKDPGSDDYEIIGRPFEAQYSGVCTLDYDHRIKRGEKISRVQHAGNPFLPVSGVACAACTVDLPRATGHSNF